MNEDKMIVTYRWPSGACEEIICENFTLENVSEIFILGFDKGTNQMTVLGVVVDEDSYYLYQVKQMKSEIYDKIINGEANKIYVLQSNIQGGSWRNKKFIKIDCVPPKLKYFLTDAPIEIVFKVEPEVFMVCDSDAEEGIPTPFKRKILKKG